MRPMLAEMRELVERAQPFAEGEVAQLRKDFLLLMKNVDRVKSYEEAEKLRQAFNRWRDLYETTLFERFIPKLDAHIADKLHIDRADLWKSEYAPLKSELDRWVKYWDEKLRKELWPLVIELSLPIEHEEDSKWQHYKTMYAAGYAARGEEFDIRKQIFEKYLKDKDKWAARVKRKARPAWAALQEYITWLGKAATIDIPSDENIELEGFKFRVIGGDNISPGHFQDVIPKLRAALKRYRARAMKVFPWIIDNQLRMELTFACGLDWAGRYHRDHIEICVFAASGESSESIAHVLAHEMGHHVYKTYLSGEAQNFWSLAIKKDRGELDLLALLKIWEKSKPDHRALMTLSDLEDYLKNDPVMYLQVQTLTHGHGRPGGESLFFSYEELKALIDGGTVKYPVPNNPITAYAAKNNEEAFCEAFGYLVAYGPRAVLPLVRSWLKTILPELRVEHRSSLRADLDALYEVLDLTEATIACGECYSYAYVRVKEGGTLVHATVTDPWEGKRYSHAWVEDGGLVYDWQTSQGLGTGKPRTRAEFYKLYKPEKVETFDKHDAMIRVLKHKHYGPW